MNKENSPIAAPSDVVLPELPRPMAVGVWGYTEPTTFTAEQMQDYARAAIASAALSSLSAEDIDKKVRDVYIGEGPRGLMMLCKQLLASPPAQAPAIQAPEAVIAEFAQWARRHLDPAYIDHWVRKFQSATPSAAVSAAEPVARKEGEHADPAQLTREQAAIIGAFTGIACGPFSDVHKKIEETLGRPVWTHEMADKTVWAMVKEIIRPEFLVICAEEGSK